MLWKCALLLSASTHGDVWKLTKQIQKFAKVGLQVKNNLEGAGFFTWNGKKESFEAWKLFKSKPKLLSPTSTFTRRVL